MSDSVVISLRETILRQILASDPTPWFPRDYAQSVAIDRESLYAPLNDLRVAGLVQLTDWIVGRGQGYVLTMLGREVLSNPTALAQLGESTALVTPRLASVDEIDRSTPTTFDIGEAARKAFYEGGRVRVVPVLMLANLVAFAGSFAMAARSGVNLWEFFGQGDPNVLEKVGALSAVDIAHGEWWRLLTNCFLHFGLMHLVLNMTTLFLARRVEALWGSGRFLVLYLICGVCGSCVAVYYNPGDASKINVLAGASGALWGVMGSEIVWLVLNRRHLPPDQTRQWFSQLSFTLLLNVGVSMLPHVSAAAHLGGGVAGLLTAFLLRVHKFGPAPKRSMAGVLLAFLPTIFLIGLSTAMANDHRLQPFLADAYREQIDNQVGRLPAALAPLITDSDRLFPLESSKRDAAEVSKVRDGLQSLIKQAKEAEEWTKKTNPIDQALPMKEKGLGLIGALIPFAEALGKQAGGETVTNMNELRGHWQDARTAWEKVIAK
ncbi:MAG TPA: rhomboid family intramembrane serine protease [Gemmataceae bacterium]|jgi:membrane associated rhomboid family serine protease|nr:rhomboid family intramembrane serine protease [Gemmataceae bacterium]